MIRIAFMTSVVFSGAYDGCVSLDDNARGVRDAKERIQKGELVKTMPLRMANGVSRAEFWKSFILDRCDFPKPELLATQFEHYDLVDFCDCSCNNFTVRVRPGSNVQILVKTSSYALVFQADFYLRDDDRTLDILLFAGGSGYIEYVEFDCCGNAYPVPEDIHVRGVPYHMFAHVDLAC